MNCMRFMFRSLSALALMPLAASANPGALEINQDCVAVGCFAGDAAGYPVTITAPGSYILTSDLTPPGNVNVNAINISAPGGVDIDLNGHTVDGGATCTGTPVTSCTGAAGSRGLEFDDTGVFHVHNGTVRGFGAIGIIFFSASDGTVLDHLTVTENAYGALIEGTTSDATTRIRDSQFVRNSQNGVSVTNGSYPLLIENSTAVGNGTIGFAFFGAGSAAVGNRINKNGGVGLSCDSGCALGENTFSNNNGGGANAQWTVNAVRNMGGNVCLEKASCP